MNVYEGADKAIRAMNRQNMKAFNRLKLAKLDELNVIREVNAVYEESVRLAKRKYYEIGIEAFIVVLYMLDYNRVNATKIADEKITMKWVDALLNEVDPVTLYEFTAESERKKQRLIEALAVALNRNAEIDKALRYWARQIGQYAVNIVDAARMEAFRVAGVKRVMWNTEQDERVCDTCGPMNGMIFDLDAVPPKPHINCRCWLSAVT